MKTLLLRSFVASGVLSMASSSALSATGQSDYALGLLIAHQDEATRGYQHWGDPQAIAPDLGFAQRRSQTEVAYDHRSSYALPVTERATLGVSVGSIGWAAEPQNAAFNPSLAYSLSDNLAVSIGLDALRLGALRSGAYNANVGCVALETRHALPLYTCSDAISYTPSNLAVSSPGSFDTGGWGRGYDVGATLALGGTRLGMRYRSGMKLDVEDETVLQTPGPLLSTELGRFTDQAVIAGLGLPESFAVGASHQLSDRWSIAGDVTWVNWSQFDDDVRITSGQNRYTNTKAWENTYRYTLGLNYEHSDHWKYRMGAAYDQSPVPSGQVSAVQPLMGEDLLWLAFGVGYSPTPRLSLDVGYAYPFFTRPQMSGGLYNNMSSAFEDESDILSAQFKWRFE
jgi:long-chain fatty acid transport protein